MAPRHTAIDADEPSVAATSIESNGLVTVARNPPSVQLLPHVGLGHLSSDPPRRPRSGEFRGHGHSVCRLRRRRRAEDFPISLEHGSRAAFIDALEGHRFAAWLAINDLRSVAAVESRLDRSRSASSPPKVTWKDRPPARCCSSPRRSSSAPSWARSGPGPNAELGLNRASRREREQYGDYANGCLHTTLRDCLSPDTSDLTSNLCSILRRQ